MKPDHLKSLIWIGTSRRELRAMPQVVQCEFGYALYLAQLGGIHRKSKPLKGFGGTGVMEIVSDHRGNSYRCIYTVRFPDRFTCCTLFRRNRRTVVKHRKPRLSSFNSACAKQNALRVWSAVRQENKYDQKENCI